MTQFAALPGFAAAKTYLFDKSQAVGDLVSRISHIDDELAWLDAENDHTGADAANRTDPLAPDPLNGTHCVQALVILQLASVCVDPPLPDLMRSGHPVRLQIAEPEAGKLFEEAALALFPALFSGHRSVQTWHLPDLSSGNTLITLAIRQLSDRLHQGEHVLIIAPDSPLIPRQVRDIIRHDLQPGSLTHEMVLAVLSLTHRPVSPRVAEVLRATLPSETALARLDILKLTIAFHAQSALGVARRLARFAQAALQNEGPLLEDVFGQPEALGAFSQLKADVDAWRAGDLGWDEVTSSLLLTGPPGCGKTLLPTAFANSAQLPIVKTSYADCQKHGHQGDMLKALDAAVTDAINAAPAVFFIDEIDAFYTRNGPSRSDRYIIGVVTGLLTQLDRLNATEGVILVAATNHPEIVDEAVIRSGRFDRHIEISPLDLKAVIGFLAAKLGDAVAEQDVRPVADRLIGATGAEVDDFIRKCRTLARELQSGITVNTLLRAADLYLPPTDDALLRRIAVHEAGHVLTGHLLTAPPARLARVSGKGGAVLRSKRTAHTDRTLNDDLAILLAGRSAESLLCETLSSGAGCGIGSDLAQATELALRAEAQFGFGQAPTLWHDLGHPPLLHTVPPEIRRRAADRLTAAQARTTALLKAHLGALTALAEALFEHREIAGDALDQLLKDTLGEGGKIRAAKDQDSTPTQTTQSDEDGLQR